MAAGALETHYYDADLNEAEEEHKERAEASALHDRLVAYVHALTGHADGRFGVWSEHSYARARGAAPPPGAHVRVLLAPPPDAPDPPDALDVERVDAPPAPLEPDAPPLDSDDSDSEPDWEARVTALAPAAPHARLADAALDALRRLRLARLAGAPRRECARAAARRLRLALAGVAGGAGGAATRPAPWLHATLLAYMPRRVRRLYEEALSEMGRAAERLSGAPVAPAPDPMARAGPALAAGAGPWLAWVSCGRARADARWVRRLRALVHVRALGAPRAPPATPEAWCAAAAGGVRAALSDVLAEAGDRAVFLGGFGAGAALAAALAGGAEGAGGGVRGLVLLAPPLLTGEGPRGAPDDALRSLRAPLLLVTGARAAQCRRGAARALARARGKVLELRGADDALRVPRAERLRRRLPQHALDAAVAEECARWLLETAEAGPGGAEEEEGAALVSRGPAATPLALLPPRRRAGALGAADIMRLPIVFADDAGALPPPAAPAPPAPAVTVTSGGATRVLGAPRRGPRPPRPARPVLLRRGVRVLPRDARVLPRDARP